MEAPLNGRCCGRACLGSYNPALVPEAPIGLIKKDSTFAVHEEEEEESNLIMEFAIPSTLPVTTGYATFRAP